MNMEAIFSTRPRWLEEGSETDTSELPGAGLPPPIAVLRPHGMLDDATYRTLISAAQAEVESGANSVITDLTDVESVSNAGALGIYIIGALLEGEHFNDLESYAVMRRMRTDIEQGKAFANLRLVGASDRVAQQLLTCGLSRLVIVG